MLARRARSKVRTDPGKSQDCCQSRKFLQCVLIVTPQSDVEPVLLPYGRHHVAGDVELVCGNAFTLDAALLADCDALYDRATLIALPPDLRQRYVRELHARLPAGCRGLLITLKYPLHEKQDPPFTVPGAEVRGLYGRDWTVATRERRDILAEQPGFVAQGVSALETVVYLLERQAG
jgi:thiopurine S-methyltransferase